MRIPDPIANTTTEAYLAYKAGVLSEGELKPKLYDPYIHLDAWLAYWAGLTKDYPVKNVGKNLFNIGISLSDWFQTYHDGVDINSYTITRTTATIEDNKLVVDSYSNTGYTWISRWVSLEKNTGYVISGKNTQAIRIVGFNSKELFSEGTLIKVKAKAPDGGTTTFNTGDYNYYAISFYPSGANEYFEDIQIEKGSEATAYEPYTGEPEMLTDEEALIAYLSGVTNTYPEEFRDPADVRVAAYLKYLVSARWGRPEYPVTNEELYLSMMDAPYIPAGEPSSDIEIDDTAEAPFKDVKMYGDTSQQTYTGKNLLKVPTSGTLESKGLKTTYQSDGSMVITGTPTDTWAAIKSWAGASGIMPAGTYTISAYGTSGAKVEVQLFEGSTAHNHFVDTGAHETHTIGYSVTATTLILSNLTVGTPVNVTVRVQIEAGSSSTDFEPYVGGVPAPNPDYPQAVNTVTGRQVVKVEGKNLWGAEEHGGIDESTGEDVYNAYRWRTVGYIPVKSNTAYTLSSNAPSNIWYVFYFYDSGKNFISSTAGYGGSQTQTTPANCEFMRCVVGDTASIKTTERQLEKGSTATDYLPYQSGEYEINLGKNLYNGSIYKTDYILSATGSEVYSEGAVITDPMEVEPNTAYTASAIWHSGRGDTYIRIGVYDKSMGWVVRYSGQLDKITFTIPANARYIRLSYYGDRTDSVQLELGSTPTTYAPYFTPIELCKIGDYQDYIYENEGKWYVRKEVGKLVQNGTEIGWYNISGSTSYARTNAATSFVKNVPFFANRGLTTPTSGTRIKIPNNNLYWYETGYESIEAFKSSLATTNLIIYAPLLTPTDTEITNTALIDQLNALKNGGSYTGTTYIKVSATDPNLPGLLKVEAYKYD